MISKSTQILRKLAGEKTIIYNDKLADGRRSYKVQGWNIRDYEKAWAHLLQGGYTSEIVTTRAYYCPRGACVIQNTRIHVD